MRKISVRITEQHYEMLEMLVASGEYASTSEALRDSIRRLLTEKKELIDKEQVRSQYK